MADREYSIERQGDSVEEKDLNELWKRESLKLMLFACEHGTVDVVKYFVTELVRPNKGWVIIISVMGNFGISIYTLHRTEEEEDKTPLYYAAMAGKHEIVAYLLSINEVSPDSETVYASVNVKLKISCDSFPTKTIPMNGVQSLCRGSHVLGLAQPSCSV